MEAMLLFWTLLLIVVVVGLVRLLPGWTAPTLTARATPLEHLQQRYARGELSTTEYEQRVRRLRKRRLTPR